MAIKKLRKLVALLTMVAVVAVGVPVISHSSAVDKTANDTAEGADSQSGEEVLDDGEVKQDGALGKPKKEDWITIKDYELITETDTFKMYLYAPRLSMILENKETGAVIESTLMDEKDDGNSNKQWNGYMKSGIVITAIEGKIDTTQIDMVNSPNSIKVSKQDQGFSAEIYFKEYKFGLTVNVALEGEKGDQLVVSVPDDSIKEELGKEGKYIGTVSLFPFMGYTFLDEQEGYMLVPDGNGALINLDNKEGRFNSGFSQMIYGKDVGFEDSSSKQYLWNKIDMIAQANKVLAPIFGMAHTEEGVGYLGIVEEGDTRASIEVHPNGATVNYNRCFAKFLYRSIYVQPLNNSNSGTVIKPEDDRTHMDSKVRYIFLSGDDVNYSTMANVYRDYLLEKGDIAKRDNKYNSRIDFLGTDREEFMLGTKAVTVTKVEDIENIFAELKSNGVSSLLSVYRGWQKGGLYSVPIKKYKADSHIGGTSALTKLIKDSAGDNYNVYLYNDGLRSNPATNQFSYNTIKQINKRAMEEEIWAEVYDTFNYLTPEKSSSTIDKFVSSYKKKDVSNLALSGLSNELFSYSYRGKFYTRKSTAEAYKKQVEKLDSDLNLILEEPFEYMWKNTDAFLNMPLGSSDYIYIDEEIPFLSMVLKGIIPMYSDYVNFEANKHEFLLQMAEAGVFPSFYLTQENSSDLIYTNSSNLFSTEYATYKDTVVEYDKILRELNNAIGDAGIKKHEKSDGVAVVTYDNGVKVYVNYTEDAVTVDGETVDAMSFSYKVGEPNE